jgi:endonuclease-3
MDAGSDYSAELREKAARIAAQLAALFPPPLEPPLNHRNNFELLCAVVLSAQSTDKKVNEITPALFAAAPTPAAMAALPVETIQAFIKQIGLAPSKAKYLKGLSEALVTRHGGVVPASFAELEAMPGIGHKTASVVLAQAFGVPAFPVDTHIWRSAVRWGLSPAGCTVQRVERDLKALYPEDSWADLHLQIIFFGRQHCPALRHDAATCPVCSWAGVAMADGTGADVAPGSAVKALPRTPRVATPAKKRARKAGEGGGPGAARALPMTP